MTRRPRVLGVIASAVPGGAESVFATLLKGLGSRFELFVVCDSNGVMVERYRAAATDLVATALNAPTHIGASRVIATMIERWSIDLVHTHLWNADLLGASAARWRRRPVVSTVHGSNFLPVGTQGLHRLRRQVLSLTYRSVYKLCERIISPSRALATDLSRRRGIRVSPRRIVIVPNGLDVDETRARTRAAVMPSAVAARLPAPLIVCVGNMFAIKGQEWLVRALPEVLKAVPSAIAVFVGEGETRRSIEELARTTGVADRVVFTGSLDNPLAVMEHADVNVMPSISEGLPIALLEAMALERPVVASRVGGIPEIVQDGVSGLLVPPASPRDLSEALIRVLGDEALRARLGSAARMTIECDWSSDRMIDQTARVYDEVLAGHAARRPT
jgi:glycosyltransferase involved in cell wall biosynthesis